MSQPSGFQARAAVRRPSESALWGAGATFGTNQIPLLSENMGATPVVDTEEGVIGQAGVADADIVGWNVGGSIETEAWYEGLEPLFLAAIGFECPTVQTGIFGAGYGGSPAPDTAVSPDAYTHLFEPDVNLHREGWLSGDRAISAGIAGGDTYWTAGMKKVRSFDLAIDKTLPTSHNWLYKDCMVKSMSLKAAPGKVTLGWDLVAHSRTRNGGLGNRDSWALPARKRVLFPQMLVYFGMPGDAMAATFSVAELELKIDNPLDAVFASGTSSENIIEPVRSDIRTVGGSIKLARFSSSIWDAWMVADTELQLMIAFTGATIAGSTQTYGMNWVMPSIKLTKAEFPVAGPGVITGDIEFQAHIPDAGGWDRTWIKTLRGYTDATNYGLDVIKEQEIGLFLTNGMGACYSRDNQGTGITLP